MSTYDDVHAEAMADYGDFIRNEEPEPYFWEQDPLIDEFWTPPFAHLLDVPLFDLDPAGTPLWVYELAEDANE